MTTTARPQQQRVGSRCCDRVFGVIGPPLSAEELAKVPCPECGRRGWTIALPLAGTYPSEVTPIHVVFIETEGPAWWDQPGALPPPLGVVIVADRISRHGGCERDGWAHVLTCERCEQHVVVGYGEELPATCPDCAGPLKNTFAVDPRLVGGASSAETTQT